MCYSGREEKMGVVLAIDFVYIHFEIFKKKPEAITGGLQLFHDQNTNKNITPNADDFCLA